MSLENLAKIGKLKQHSATPEDAAKLVVRLLQCLSDTESHLHFEGMKVRERRREVLKVDVPRQIASDKQPICRFALTVFQPL